MKGREVPSLLLLYFLFGFGFCCSVTQSYTTFCDPMDCSISGFLLCPSLSHQACSDSCPLNRWRYLVFRWFHIVWRRKWQPPSVFLPGEFRGQRSLTGYSPWGRKELGLSDYHSLIPYCQADNIKHCLK